MLPVSFFAFATVPESAGGRGTETCLLFVQVSKPYEEYWATAKGPSDSKRLAPTKAFVDVYLRDCETMKCRSARSQPLFSWWKCSSHSYETCPPTAGSSEPQRGVSHPTPLSTTLGHPCPRPLLKGAAVGSRILMQCWISQHLVACYGIGLQLDPPSFEPRWVV